MQGYLVSGSDEENKPVNPEALGGTKQAAKMRIRHRQWSCI